MTPAFPLRDCTAIITGASSGLGAEFTRQIADKATCLVLAARGAEALQEIANELQKHNSSLRVVICPCDIATDVGRTALWKCVDASGIKPTLLINNAGVGDYGDFTNADEARVMRQIDLNITALTLLTLEFVKRAQATAEHPAAVLNVSSLASVTPLPQVGVYAATKAYVSSLSETLHIELAPRHVRVLAVCPGPTPTNFSRNARRANGRDIVRTGQDLLRLPPSQVVATALRELERDAVRVFPGWRVTLAAFLFEKMPRAFLRAGLARRYRQATLKN